MTPVYILYIYIVLYICVCSRDIFPCEDYYYIKLMCFQKYIIYAELGMREELWYIVYRLLRYLWFMISFIHDDYVCLISPLLSVYVSVAVPVCSCSVTVSLHVCLSVRLSVSLYLSQTMRIYYTMIHVQRYI